VQQLCQGLKTDFKVLFFNVFLIFRMIGASEIKPRLRRLFKHLINCPRPLEQMLMAQLNADL